MRRQNDDETKLKTISEYIFFDQFKEIATFPRFERVLKPLFHGENIEMDNIFKEIVGEKKKYLTFPRLKNAFENRNKNEQLEFFFDKLLNKILQFDNVLGEVKENCFNFATSISCRNRRFMTLIEVLTDKEGKIHGLNVKYDEVFNCRMYPLKIEDDLRIALKMNLGLVDESPITEEKIGKFMGLKEENYRDNVTHVFGTINQTTGYITFLGFKCVSGKTQCVGHPDGKGFIFGNYGKKLQHIKLQMTTEGINMIELEFEDNPRKNFFLNDPSYLDSNPEDLIKDEIQLCQLTDPNDIDKMITTPIIEDNHFFNKKLEDIIKGNDYKEVVEQVPRTWILRSNKKPPKKNQEPKLRTLNDALCCFDEECKNRSSKVLKSKRSKQKKLKSNRMGCEHDEDECDHCLHKTKKLKKKGAKRWDGNVKNANPMQIIKNKENYDQLLDRIGKKITDEVISGDGDNDVKQSLLNMIVSNPAQSRRENKRKKSNQSRMRHNKKNTKKIKYKDLKGNEERLERDSGNKLRSGRRKSQQQAQPQVFRGGFGSLFSDGFKIFDDIGGSSFLDDFFGYGSNSNRGGYNKYSFFDYNDPFGNDDYYDYNYHYNTEGNYYDDRDNKKPKKKEYEYDPEKYKAAQENWKYFVEELRKVNGVYLLQTIGSVISALKAIENDDNNVKRISLLERIRLYRILEENKTIVNFLSQTGKKEEENQEENKEDIKEDNIIVDVDNGEENEEEDEDDDDELIPEKHPEEITSLEELEENIKMIKTHLEDKSLSKKDRENLEKLYKLYLQRKNILIENETKIAKDEVINNNNIDINELIKEEEERRKKAAEEEKKKLEDEQKKKAEEETSKNKETINSMAEIPNPKKIYKDQEIYTGDTEWTDPLFKPEKKSLCPYNSSGWVLPEDVWESDVDGWERFKWARAEDILDTQKYSVFEDGISYSDINQGSIGDCYFLSVIGSLCKEKELLNKLFLYQTKTKEHEYGVYLFIHGHWELVLVDDYFPYVGYGFKQFAFGSSKGNELWVCLLEKAWAKINGCYAKIGCGGTPNEVFSVLTECSSIQKTIQTSSSAKEQLWQLLMENKENKYVMTAGTSGDTSNSDIEEKGLSPGHAYTVIDVYEVGSRKERIIRLRNPWGSGEWNGSWSDASSKWTSSAKREVGYEIIKNDGDFCMDFDDFTNYFVTMGMAKLYVKHKTTLVRVTKKEAVKLQVIKLHVSDSAVGQPAYFSVYQKNPRIILKYGYYQKTVLGFVMLTDDNFNFIGATCSTGMHISLEEKDLKEGDYYLFTDLNYRYVNSEKNHGYNVTAYAKDIIDLENVTDKINTSEALEKALISYAKKNLSSSTDSSGVKVYTSRNYANELPFTIVVFDNVTSNDVSATFKISGRGAKSYCIYADSDASESDSQVIKNIPAGSAKSVAVMKYSLSSLYSMSYIISKTSNKSNTNSGGSSNNTGRKTTDYTSLNPVFNEQGDPIDEEGYLYQYVLEKSNGYTIGLANEGPKKEKLKLILEGLEFSDAANRGRSVSASFYIGPGEKRVFNTIVKKRYRGELSFEFNYA